MSAPSRRLRTQGVRVGACQHRHGGCGRSQPGHAGWAILDERSSALPWASVVSTVSAVADADGESGSCQHRLGGCGRARLLTPGGCVEQAVGCMIVQWHVPLCCVSLVSCPVVLARDRWPSGRVFACSLGECRLPSAPQWSKRAHTIGLRARSESCRSSGVGVDIQG